MTTTPTASPELLDLDHLEALARAADQGEGQHIYTNPRDSEGWQANEAWHRAASPDAVLALIALARRAQPYATGGMVPGGLRLAGETPQATCTVPPEGWHCTRAPGHDGPCAAWPIAQQAAAPGVLEKSARALAEKWHKDAVNTGFATSDAAVELLEVLDAAPSAPGTPEAPKGGE